MRFGNEAQFGRDLAAFLSRPKVLEQELAGQNEVLDILGSVLAKLPSKRQFAEDFRRAWAQCQKEFYYHHRDKWTEPRLQRLIEDDAAVLRLRGAFSTLFADSDSVGERIERFRSVVQDDLDGNKPSLVFPAWFLAAHARKWPIFKPSALHAATKRWGLPSLPRGARRYEGYCGLLSELQRRLGEHLADPTAQEAFALLWFPKGYLVGAGAISEKELDQAGKSLDEGFFDPSSVGNEREMRLRSIAIRRGQPAFRKKLLRVYERRCAVTGCDAPEALEAAHIDPYLSKDSHHVTNGVLLRADLHTLFDRGMLGFAYEGPRLVLVLHEGLTGTTYSRLPKAAKNLPRSETARPSAEALAQHLERHGLRGGKKQRKKKVKAAKSKGD